MEQALVDLLSIFNWIQRIDVRMKSKLLNSANETLHGVFHAHQWGQKFSAEILDSLIEEARVNTNRKARICLHPSPGDFLQVAYLAFSKPYSDRIHNHPHTPKVVIPISGQARFSTFDFAGNVLSSQILDGECPVAISLPTGVWHALEVLSQDFIKLEAGTGPFLKDSTVFLENSYLGGNS